MTLLLGSRSREQILLSADGLSTSDFGGGPSVGRSTLQKLFECGRFAVGHYGDNWLRFEGKNIGMKQLVNYWKQSGVADSIGDALDSLCRYVSRHVDSKTRGGFWFAGFNDQRQPECYRIEPPQWRPAVIQAAHFMSGDGAQFVPAGWSDHIAAFEAAYDLQKQSGMLVFGGHLHQLRITQDGCHWTVPWQNIGLGTAEILTSLPNPMGQVDSPRDCIIEEMNRLKDDISRSSGLGGKRRPGLAKMEKEWKGDSPIDWQRAYQLVAIGDEAEHAEPAEVIEANALLFRSHVDALVTSLPSKV